MSAMDGMRCENRATTTWTSIAFPAVERAVDEICASDASKTDLILPTNGAASPPIPSPFSIRALALRQTRL